MAIRTGLMDAAKCVPVQGPPEVHAHRFGTEQRIAGVDAQDQGGETVGVFQRWHPHRFNHLSVQEQAVWSACPAGQTNNRQAPGGMGPWMPCSRACQRCAGFTGGVAGQRHAGGRLAQRLAAHWRKEAPVAADPIASLGPGVPGAAAPMHELRRQRPALQFA